MEHQQVRAPHPAYIEDVLSIIVKTLDFDTLFHSLRQCPRPAPKVVQKEVKNRIYDAVSMFIPEDKTDRFFKILHELRGAVVGSVARRLFVHIPGETSTENKPADLNIVLPRVPSSKLALLEDFLWEMDFHRPYGFVGALRFRHHAKSCRLYERLHEGKVCGFVFSSVNGAY